MDFPLCNILGYIAYTTSTTAFLFSDLIKRQYAFRHPRAPISTVTPEDFAFAAHGLLISLIVTSQFWPKLWGFHVPARKQQPSRVVLGIFWGCIVGVLIVIFMVLKVSPDGGNDPHTYAWIDVVSVNSRRLRVARILSTMSVTCLLLIRLTMWIDLCSHLCQIGCDCGQIHSASMG
jgi:cystinosin